MAHVVRDNWIDSQEVVYNIAELEDCSIAIDATYFVDKWMDGAQEPLLSALAGSKTFEKYIEDELEAFKAHRITPFFIFDGQPVVGQDDILTTKGTSAHHKTSLAWEYYIGNNPSEAVDLFGHNSGAIRPQTGYYPLLQRILRRRGLHFLVPPSTAAAQIAYFDKIDSDQVAGIMGSHELLLYPIHDCVIRDISFDSKQVTAISKRHIVSASGLNEQSFVDALLMRGTTFLPPFPALLETSIIKSQPFTVRDAMNLLRTSEKSVTAACTSFSDILKTQDANWLDKYRKARMAVSHFVYIDESGEIMVNDYEHLTKDNHEYLGLQLPSELFHYLNTGLVGPRLLGALTHGELNILPTPDGTRTEAYKSLVSKHLVPIWRTALGLLTPRLHRGIMHHDVKLKVWYDRNFTHTLWDRDLKLDVNIQAATWTARLNIIAKHKPDFVHGSIVSEVLALQNTDLVKSTFVADKEKVKGVESPDAIVTVAIWRFLHLRGYVDDSHKLTSWGSALATAITFLLPTAKEHPEVEFLFESLVLAFEQLRFGLLRGTLRLEGEQETNPNANFHLLISRCASFLKLRHQLCGYSGALSKYLLAYHSLVAEVRAADRDLVEAVLANMFLYAQAKRQRDDNWELSHRLPFAFAPDASLAVAVKTWLDIVPVNATPDEIADHKTSFPPAYVGHAEDAMGDFERVYELFDAVFAGIKTLSDKDLSSEIRQEWANTSAYLKARRAAGA